MLKKTILTSIVLLFIVSAVGHHFYQKIHAENVHSAGAVFIKSTFTIEEVATALKPFVTDSNSFLWVAKQKRFTHIKPGKYLLKKGSSNNALVNLLRSGDQSPITISFNNQHSIENLAGRLAQQLEADSVSIEKTLLDSLFLVKNKYNKQTALEMYIPNSYEVYWTISPEKLRARMQQEFQRFWSQSRKEKAAKLDLTISQVMALAAIVQKETVKKSERPIVAGLYLNRLQNGWPLQADPTIIYALKEKYGQDYEVKRVLNKDLHIQSPYNTYKHKGLPPSLIAMPDISAIDAVLNPSKHRYFYMCASTTNIGYHDFAKNLRTHNNNAAKYQRWIHKKGIRR